MLAMVAVASAVTFGWAGWELLRQERAAEEQRERERLENRAEREREALRDERAEPRGEREPRPGFRARLDDAFHGAGMLTDANPAGPGSAGGRGGGRRRSPCDRS